VRADDSASDGGLVQALAERSDTPVDQGVAGSYFVAAVRELFEEAGVLLARTDPTMILAVDDADTALQERLASARLALQAGQLSLADRLPSTTGSRAFDLLCHFALGHAGGLGARFDTRREPRQAALHSHRDRAGSGSHRRRCSRRLSGGLRDGSAPPPHVCLTGRGAWSCAD
jgi:8-oxo-dGTP pyrophosphatase MutT (NUDIX family)